MSNEKYYVPKIEEFHVGFEYEAQDLVNSDSEEPNKWFKRNVTIEALLLKENDWSWDLNNFNSIHSLLLTGRIRVKFLDGEDIEAEGWYFNKSQTLPVYELFTPKGLYDLIKSHPDFYGQDKYTVTLHESGTKNSFTLFSGTIKNRSELRKVMEMIGITK